MKIKIVPASELSPKTLRAEDYVLKPFKVTYVEEIERDVTMHLNADTNDEAQSMLEEMSDEDFMEHVRKGRRKDMRVIDRQVAGVEEG